MYEELRQNLTLAVAEEAESLLEDLVKGFNPLSERPAILTALSAALIALGGIVPVVAKPVPPPIVIFKKGDPPDHTTDHVELSCQK